MDFSSLKIKGARQNNLKNVDLQIPHGKIVVITGPSGSGKSSLAFDTIYTEGQRRYIESLSTYARQFLTKLDKPDFDTIENITPTIALEQKNTIKNSRSTVGTITEIYDFLRILFSSIGKPHCPNCHISIKNYSTEEILEKSIKEYSEKKIFISFQKDIKGISFEKLKETLLSNGFDKIILNDQIHYIEEIKYQDIKDFKKIFVLVDRFKSTSQIEKNRVLESLQTAYLQGDGLLFLHVGKTFRKFNLNFQCPECHYLFPNITPQFFSFNSPYGACKPCKGFGNILDIDEQLVIPNTRISIYQGAIEPFRTPSKRKWYNKTIDFCIKNGIDIKVPYSQLTKKERDLLFYGNKSFKGVKGFFQLLEKKKYKLHVRVLLSRYKSPVHCPECDGFRLRYETKTVFIKKENVQSVCQLQMSDLSSWLNNLDLSQSEKKITQDLLPQIIKRVNLINDIGLGYLTLNRLARTLSGGEVQRILLTNQIGSFLTSTTYVLDEPTIGLHARDNERLIQIIRKLKEFGNSVLIVEHDRRMMEIADHIIDLGPGSGTQGGYIVFEGTYNSLIKNAVSKTAQYLNQSLSFSNLKKTRRKTEEEIHIINSRGNNLKNLDVSFPLHQFIAVTGVSGAGKSTLLINTLFRGLKSQIDPNNPQIKSISPGPFDQIVGREYIRDVILIDQKPIGKSSRSNPVSYIDCFSPIRKIFANTLFSKKRGYTPGHFSFNSASGQCPKCKGTGNEEVDMHFLGNITIRCDLCHGKRFQRDILDIEYQGKNISDILFLTVDEAIEFFKHFNQLIQKLKILQEVGLGYIQLGQPANTLSGGESQRIKIAKHLISSRVRNYLFILDEPTTGLHFIDIQNLLILLHRLVDEGNTVIVIEHNLEVALTADIIIDIGPEGGEGGGQLVAKGTPKEVANNKDSLTGKFLRELL